MITVVCLLNIHHLTELQFFSLGCEFLRSTLLETFKYSTIVEYSIHAVHYILSHHAVHYIVRTLYPYLITGTFFLTTFTHFSYPHLWPLH